MSTNAKHTKTYAKYNLLILSENRYIIVFRNQHKRKRQKNVG